MRRLVGGLIGLFPGITKSVMLWAGSVAVSVAPGIARSARRVMTLVAVNCQACAVPRFVKFTIPTLAVVLADEDLLIAITVSAPSDVRTAAKAETVSGFGTPAATLVSPNVDLLPS